MSPRLKSAYGVAEEAVLTWCDALRKTAAVFLDSLPDIGQVCRDPNDDHVIATAIAVKARVIVTSDKDLLALGQFQIVRMITARVFLTKLAPDQM